MNEEKMQADFLVDIMTDDTKLTAAIVISVIKGVVIAILFSVITCLLFEGLWLWVGIGLVLLVVLPLWNVKKLLNVKNDFDEVNDLLGGVSDNTKKTILKTMIEASSIFEQQNKNIKPLTQKASLKILQSLQTDSILHKDVAIETLVTKSPYSIIELLRTHAKPRICSYDCEFIDDDDAYAWIFNEHLAITQGELVVENISSSFNYEKELAEIKFTFKGEEIYWQFSQPNDWVSDSFFKHVSEFATNNTKSKFLMFPAEDQCAEILYVPKTSAKLLVRYGILIKL